MILTTVIILFLGHVISHDKTTSSEYRTQGNSDIFRITDVFLFYFKIRISYDIILLNDSNIMTILEKTELLNVLEIDVDTIYGNPGTLETSSAFREA